MIQNKVQRVGESLPKSFQGPYKQAGLGPCAQTRPIFFGSTQCEMKILDFTPATADMDLIGVEDAVQIIPSAY